MSLMRTTLLQTLLKMTHAPEKTFFSKTSIKTGGERGIRTPGAYRHIRFRVEHNRPLCHLSATKKIFNYMIGLCTTNVRSIICAYTDHFSWLNKQWNLQR